MGNWSSFNRVLAVWVGSTLLPNPLVAQSQMQTSGPLPILGTLSVSEGRWNQLPDLLLHLPQDLESASLHYQLAATAAEQYFAQGLLDESRKAFQKLLKAKKPFPPSFFLEHARLRSAEIALLQGQIPEAFKLLELLSHNPNPYIAEEALFLIARCYLAKRQWTDVEKVVGKLLKQNPAFGEDLSLNLLRGATALEQGDVARALPFFTRFPDEPSALYYQAVCLIQQKELSKAIPIYQQILQKHTRSEWLDRLRLVLGETFYQAGDLTMAAQFISPVTRPEVIPSLRVLALHRQATLFFKQQKYDTCEKTLTFLLKTFPDHPLRSQWTYLYASVPIYKKDWKKAIQEQKEALEMERGLAPKIFGVDEAQLRLSAQFRILWARLLLNDFNGTLRLADTFIRRYSHEPIAAYAYLAKGLSYYRLGEYDRAIEVYQELLNKFPQSSACGKAVYLMTLCLHSARDPFRVAGILHQLHERWGKANFEGADEWTQNTLYWIADAYYQIDDFASAEKVFREFLQKAPQSPLAPYAMQALGATFSAQGPHKDAEAEIAMQQALLRANDLNLKPLAEQTEMELGKVCYNLRQFDKASETWNHLAQLSAAPAVKAEALFHRADALARQQFFLEAVKNWKQLAQNHKNSLWVPEALWRMGNTHMGLTQWPEAVESFKTLAKSYPNSDFALQAEFQLVACAFNKGDYPAASVELIAFAKRRPDDSRIPEMADNILQGAHQNRLPLPTDQQIQLMKLSPGRAGGAAILWERAALLYNEKKYEVGQKIFEKIMLSYPNDEHAPMAYFYDAECLFSLKRWEEAAMAYQNFFQSFPNHEKMAEAMFQKAVCLFQKESYEQAVKDFETFLGKFPQHPWAKDAWLNIALAHKKAFRLDQAVLAYRQTLQRYGSDPKMNAVWLKLGTLLEVQGKRSEALQSYAQVPKEASEYPEALYHQAVLLEQEHGSASVRKLYEELRGWPDPKNEYRVAALIKLTELYEQEGASKSQLIDLYQDVQASCSDPEIVRLAGERLKELGK